MVRRILLLVSICISCNIYAYDWFNIADSIAICQKKVSPSWCNYDIDRYMIQAREKDKPYRFKVYQHIFQVNEFSPELILFLNNDHLNQNIL